MRKRDISAYPGSKNVPPFKPLLFNVLPEVHTFVDCFSGSGYVSAIVEEFVSAVICFEAFEPTREQLLEKFSGSIGKITLPAGRFDLSAQITGDSSNLNLRGTKAYFMDPPYMFSTRRAGNALYGCEWSDADHVAFLNTLDKKLYYSPGRVDNFAILTHPRCELYLTTLAAWHKVDFTYSTRRGVMTDTMWLNYDPSKVQLACTDFIGKDHTERQQIDRKLKSMHRKFLQLSTHEKQRFLQLISKK